MTQADMLMLIANLYRRHMFWQTVSKAVIVAELALLTTLMAGASLITALYAAYLYGGMESPITALSASVIGVLVTVILAVVTMVYTRRLRRKESGPEACAREIAEAFFKGLLEQ